jgi:hypothetical protein
MFRSRRRACALLAFDHQKPKQRPNDQPFGFIKRNCRCASPMKGMPHDLFKTAR